MPGCSLLNQGDLGVTVLDIEETGGIAKAADSDL